MSDIRPESEQLVDKHSAESRTSTSSAPLADNELQAQDKNSDKSDQEDEQSSGSAETELSENLGCAAFFLSLGLTFLAIPAAQVLLPTAAPERSINRFGMVSLTIGTPMVASSVWGIVNSVFAAQKARKDRLRRTFHNLLEQNQGRISLLTFNRETNISGQEAKDFLNERAQEFNGTFELGENGGINYLFEISPT